MRFSRSIRITEDFRITPSIGAMWQDRDRVNYYYGVRPEEALPDRPAYNGRDTVDVSAGAAGAYRLPRSWSLLGGVFVIRYGDGIVDSPIVTQRYSTVVYGGGGWRF